MLTKKQRDLLLYINSYIQETGLSPSFEEMKQGLELKSKSGIHRLINALVERGFLQRLPNKARALEVCKLPENMAQPANTDIANTDNVTNLKSIATSATPSPAHPMEANDDELVQIPLYGKIAAGTPIDALRNETEMVSMPASMLGRNMSYALTIEGDSMINAGIMDGDIVIIEQCSHANDGDIVVALVDGEEATLKRLRREFGSVILVPENDAYEAIQLAPERVQIQGKLRSLLRNY